MRVCGIFIMKCIVSILFIIIGSFNVHAQCTNSSSYGSVSAPASGVVTSIATDQYQSDYTTISSVVSGNTYISSYNNLGGGAVA